MKILQVIPSLGIGGAETLCCSLSIELVRQGHEVIVVSMYNSDTFLYKRLLDSGIKVIFLNKKSGFDFSLIAKIKKIIEVDKPDAIHTHMSALKYTFLATINSNRKIIHTIHNVAKIDSGKIDRILNRHFFLSGRVIPVALSSEVKESIVNTYPLLPDKVPIVINGANIESIIKKQSYSTDIIKIVSVARFNPIKRHKRMLEAFNILNKNMENTQLYLYGSGETQEEIKTMAKQLNLEDKIFFMGVSNRIAELLYNYDIYLNTSDYEGVPISIVEAMAAGLPIVATKVGGVPDLIMDGDNGILTSLDASSVASALTSLCKDEMYRQNLGCNAYKTSKKYSISKTALNYSTLYQDYSKDE